MSTSVSYMLQPCNLTHLNMTTPAYYDATPLVDVEP